MLCIQSLCFNAGLMVICLYLCALTIFLPFVVWDTMRVEKRRKECFGACFCQESSVLFFKGKYLTPVQKKFSKSQNVIVKNNNPIVSVKSAKSSGKKTEIEAESQNDGPTVASYTEIFLLKKVAPELLSKAGKVSVLFVYFIWTIISIYGVYNVKVEFSFDYFMTDKSLPIYKYR